MKSVDGRNYLPFLTMRTEEPAGLPQAPEGTCIFYRPDENFVERNGTFCFLNRGKDGLSATHPHGILPFAPCTAPVNQYAQAISIPWIGSRQ
jgi:hypothetical protein